MTGRGRGVREQPHGAGGCALNRPGRVEGARSPARPGPVSAWGQGSGQPRSSSPSQGAVGSAPGSESPNTQPRNPQSCRSSARGLDRIILWCLQRKARLPPRESWASSLQAWRRHRSRSLSAVCTRRWPPQGAHPGCGNRKYVTVSGAGRERSRNVFLFPAAWFFWIYFNFDLFLNYLFVCLF